MTFERAIAITDELIENSDRLTPETIQQRIADLVSTENGARGFFVTYLTSDRPFAEVPTGETLAALAVSPAIVGELLVKNLAMSTAMAFHHRRNAEEENALGSDRVRQRTSQLIRSLSLPEITEKLYRLQESLENGGGDYEKFLDRWGYDREQRQAIAQVTRTQVTRTQVTRTQVTRTQVTRTQVTRSLLPDR
jgi:hypothetical protein